ncbi:transcription factor 20 [Mustelus asterias]
MQSYREQSSYHGNQRLLHQEAPEASRLANYSQHHQGQVFASYASRPGSEGCTQQPYQAFRREPSDYYYTRGKELAGPQAQRRLPGPLQSGGFGTQQAGGYSVQYLSEVQWRAPHSAMPGYSQFEQDAYAGQFSPGGGQQQLRHQGFPAAPSTQTLAQPPPSSAHHPQHAHQPGAAQLAKYQHRATSYNPQQFQPAASTSSSSSSSSSSSYLSPQGYSQPPGQAFDGYPMSASAQCDGYLVSATAAPSYGTQTGYSYQPPLAKPCFEQAKPAQAQQHGAQALQYSNAAKVPLGNQQFAPYCTADIPAKSPMPFHQNFSPSSNPSPATPVAQSPSCSSTPSPLMVSSESLQCGPGAMGMRNRVLQLMPQPSPTPTGLMPSPGSQAGAYESFGLEAGPEKRASDLGQSSLTALSSQVANIPNRVQHLLISDTLALHRRQARRSHKRAAPGGPNEHLGLEEQLKSPQAESLDGGCSSSSEDHAERVRQLSGQSGCSERAYKAHNPELVNATCSPASSHGDGRPLSKEEMIAQMCQEGKGGAMATLAEQGLRRGEKPVGVIVARETMVGRGDGVGLGGQGDEHARQTPFLANAEKEPSHGQQLNNLRNIMAPSMAQNGNGLGSHQGNMALGDPLATRMDSSKSPSYLAYGLRDIPKNDGRYHYMQYPMAPYSQSESEQFSLGDRKIAPSKAGKSHSLLQEALQANYHGRKFHSSYAPEHQYPGFMDNPLQPGYPVRQMIELARKEGHGSALASPPLGWRDARTPGPGFGMEMSKADLEAQFEAGISERKSVICDVSPSRLFGRSPGPLACGQAQDRELGRNAKGAKACKAGQSVIQSGIFAGTETKVKAEVVPSLGQQRSFGHYDTRDPGNPSPHWKYDSLELARASVMVSSPLPVGTTGNFLHQALNHRSSRGRRSCGRVAGRSGARRRAPSRVDDKALLARAPLIKQEDALEPPPAGFLGQPRENAPAQAGNANLYPLPTNSEMLSSLLAKPDDVRLAGIQALGTARPPNHLQRQVADMDRVNDWTQVPGGKDFAAGCCRSGIPKEPWVSNAAQLEPGIHPSFQSHGEGRGPRLDESSKEAERLAQASKKVADSQEDPSVLSPILARRRIRSFISPIPAKRLCQDSRGRDTDAKLAPPHGHSLPPCIANRNLAQKAEAPEDVFQNADGKDSPGATVTPPVSLASPGKLKTLPPRKGRGLKLEAIVQKIASPNGRKFPVSGMLDSASDGVTLEDILSIKEGCWESEEVPMAQPGGSLRGGPAEGPEAQLGSLGGANCSQSHGGTSPAARVPYHPDFKQRSSPCPLPRSPEREARPEPVAPKLEGGTVKGYFPSGKKRGRPLGSINKQKRQRLECQGGQGRPEEPAQKKRRPRRKKAPAHQRRRRKKLEGPILLPQEPEIKLKLTARPAGRRRGENQDKSFSPYVLLERKREAALLCTIINTQDDERNRAQKGVKGQQGPASTPPPSCAGKALPTTSHMVLGPLVTECTTLGLLVCCLCGKCANHRDLGDLYGPYYPHQYAGTLPKNPPPKKMLPVQSRVKVRHKSMPELLSTAQSEDEGKEFGNVLGHPRFKRRHYSEDCTPSWASPRSSKGHRHCFCCGKTSPSVNLRTQRLKSEFCSEVDLQLPQLPLDPNELWIHESCVLWASGVYLVSGRLYGLQEAVEMARETKCSHCQEPGATLGCYCKGCPLNYHYICAIEADCFLNEENFSMKCPRHKHRAAKPNSTEQSEQG